MRTHNFSSAGKVNDILFSLFYLKSKKHQPARKLSPPNPYLQVIERQLRGTLGFQKLQIKSEKTASEQARSQPSVFPHTQQQKSQPLFAQRIGVGHYSPKYDLVFPRVSGVANLSRSSKGLPSYPKLNLELNSAAPQKRLKCASLKVVGRQKMPISRIICKQSYFEVSQPAPSNQRPKGLSFEKSLGRKLVSPQVNDADYTPKLALVKLRTPIIRFDIPSPQKTSQVPFRSQARELRTNKGVNMARMQGRGSGRVPCFMSKEVCSRDAISIVNEKSLQMSSFR